MKYWNIVGALMIAALCATSAAAADEEKKASTENTADKQALFKKFTETLNNVKLVGRFTVLGKEDKPPAKEEYTITSVTKLDEGDFWLFRTRIKYGDKDVAIPLALEVKWAGDTPIITLTDFAIPQLGTFSSRVIIYDNQYAGTWTHGQVGGHLFGTIEKIKADEQNGK
jgi:hypothetical protein